MTASEATGAEHGRGAPGGAHSVTAPASGTDWNHGTDWDAVADTFDEEADHGLRDPAVRAAWAGRMGSWLPETPSDVLDLGCGTGSLALLAAEAGHRVTAVDRSPRMAGRARAKLTGGGYAGARVLTGDAEHPPFAPRSFDVVLVRHLLWVLPDPAAALRRWCALLRPGGRLVLVEGFWNGTGIPAARLTALLAPLSERVHTESLSEDARLWGRAVDDERYAALAVTAPVRRHKEIVDVHLVLRRGDEVLLARRANTGYADGLLHAPSGHVEDGEDVLEAMVREAAEEVGLRLRPEDLRVATVMQHAAPSGAPRIGWFFEAEYGAGGEPFNAEPHKCSELGWYPLSGLPHDLVAYCRAGLLAYREGHRFVLHRHEPADPVAADPAVPDRARVLPATRPAEKRA